MVKKILYTIGIMMFMAAVAKPLYAVGADFSGNEEDVPFSSARIFSKMVNAIGGSDTAASADWGEIFGEDDDEDVGQDLYLTVYKKTINEPQKQAFKNIAGRYGTTETDMVKIMYGDFTKIIEKKPTLTQSEAYDKMAEIQLEFAEEKDILQLEADIKAAVEPNEIFANDDITDSGFDLINDLQIIENLLFLKSQPIDVGGAFAPSETAEETPESGAGGNGGGSGGAGSGGGGGGGTGGSPGQTGTGATTGQSPSALTGGETVSRAGAADTGTGAPSPSAAEEKGVNPNSCFEENSIEQALQDFEERKATDKNLKDGSDAVTEGAGPLSSGMTIPLSSGAPSGGAGGGPAGGGPGSYQPTTDFMQPAGGSPAPAQVAPADNWLQPKECEGVFCLFVEFVSEPVKSTYQDIDNCIACHVEKINDQLKETINHSLVPAKAPGNLGESAKCKKAMWEGFEAINMNIYATPVPVETPANDDLIFGKSIEDEWYDFCNAMSFPFSCRKEDEPPASPELADYGIPPSLTDVLAKKELTNAVDSTTMSEVTKKLDLAEQKYAEQRRKDLQAYAVSEKADLSIGSFDPLKLEMDQMNFYFTNIRDILHSLHEPAGEGSPPHSLPGPQACVDLGEKSECE